MCDIVLFPNWNGEVNWREKGRTKMTEKWKREREREREKERKVSSHTGVARVLETHRESEKQ